MQSRCFKTIVSSTKELGLFIPCVGVLSHANCISITWHMGEGTGWLSPFQGEPLFPDHRQVFSVIHSLSSWSALGLSQLHRSPDSANFMVGGNTILKKSSFYSVSLGSYLCACTLCLRSRLSPYQQPGTGDGRV